MIATSNGGTTVGRRIPFGRYPVCVWRGGAPPAGQVLVGSTADAGSQTAPATSPSDVSPQGQSEGRSQPLNSEAAHATGSYLLLHVGETGPLPDSVDTSSSNQESTG